ncbi:MAG: PEP-CTERM sorting domain-containing protein [Sphingomonadales bacterium]|nr:PEP-CTERM sorting domain-containing protein [Sphingomonadales bacterium]MBD3773478.1 PEP-CTERM sorting domain-containing protein [Paracoccaceae bacterium]
MRRLLVPTMLILLASPAYAAGGVAVPEPSNLGLFLLGVIGVILGRRGARRRRPPDE